MVQRFHNFNQIQHKPKQTNRQATTTLTLTPTTNSQAVEICLYKTQSIRAQKAASYKKIIQYYQEEEEEK